MDILKVLVRVFFDTTNVICGLVIVCVVYLALRLMVKHGAEE